MDLDLIRNLIKTADTKIVLVVMDGLGGLPLEEGGLTELEAAHTPNLDHLASRSICGLHVPVGAGITPGSGPAHQALFGYDPITFYIGRGALAAVGIDFPLTSRDVVARGNFCTVDKDGLITDRRAGRISSEINSELCGLLRKIELAGIELFVETVKGYRFIFVLRGDGLSSDITDSDPQEIGRKPLEPQSLSPDGEQTARFVQQFLKQAPQVLAEHHPANMVLLRGFAKGPRWPQIGDLFGLRAVAVADYPMYRGVARLMGMDVVDVGDSLEEKISILRNHWNDYDFFFLHIKDIDVAGEDGNFDGKVSCIETVDRHLPKLQSLRPDVLIITGDHSTPSRLLEHSWHPIPVIIWSEYCLPDDVNRFGERSCMRGGLGPRFPTTEIMPLALAHAMRLNKFGG